MEPQTTKASIIIKPETKKVEGIDEPHLEGFRKELEGENVSKTTYVCLSGNSYSPAFCEKMGEHLTKMDKLECLNVSDCFVGRDKEMIPKAIESLFFKISPTLHSVDLSNNAMGPHGAGAFAKYLSSGPQALRVLLINNCGLGAAGLKILSEALLTGKVSLEVLSIGRNRMEDDGAVSLSNALKEMPKLKDLRVFQNFIRDKGMLALLSVLNLACSDLVTLDVNDNYVKNQAVDELAKLLKTHKGFKNLNISDCNLEPEDAPKVIQALEETEAVIEKIGYNYNNLEESTEAKRFLDAVVKNENKKIQTINIKGNEFKKSTKAYYKEKLTSLQLEAEKILSAFESDDDEEEQVIKEFSELKI